MLSLSEDCELVSLSDVDLIRDFDCGHPDLNEFFCKDAIHYQNELLGKTFFFREKLSGRVVCAYTVSNDSIKVNELPNARKKAVKELIPHAKSQKSYPATLIGRLGVGQNFAGHGIGTQLMNFIKYTTLIEDPNQCRFLLVDAYNNDTAMPYYAKNGFKTVFSTEDQEKDHYQKNGDEPLKTRFMYYDLKIWKDEMDKAQIS